MERSKETELNPMIRKNSRRDKDKKNKLRNPTNLLTTKGRMRRLFEAENGMCFAQIQLAFLFLNGRYHI